MHIIQLTADEIDDLLYFTRANEAQELHQMLAELSKRYACDTREVLEACLDQETSNTVLHYCAANGLTDLLQSLLGSLKTSEQNGKAADRPQLMNRQNQQGNTPLHWAAYNGHLPSVKLLVGAGADMWVKNTAGHLAMFEAERAEKSEVVQYLLEAGGRTVEQAGREGVATKEDEVEVQDGETQTSRRMANQARQQKLHGSSCLRSWYPRTMAYRVGMITPVTTATDDNSSRLLNLPPELRDMIWLLALTARDPIAILSPKSKHARSLIQTSPQIRRETSGIFYASNTFLLEINDFTKEKALRWLSSVPPQRLPLITKVLVSFEWADYERSTDVPERSMRRRLQPYTGDDDLNVSGILFAETLQVIGICPEQIDILQKLPALVFAMPFMTSEFNRGMDDVLGKTGTRMVYR
ncbi:ankyrin repeat-containing protein [Teratosphaeriaceae sp. CCFEE 6253]|nr:ankyrin repeat-containing protein [Teratosphaeriaceae sp. CCFEE 6253]